MHGGAIGVFSEGEGKGSTFSFRLPIVRTPESVHIPPEPSSVRYSRSKRTSVIFLNTSSTYRTKKVAPYPGCPAQVLVVDDSELIRKVMTSTLSRLGYVVHCACDGSVAVNMIRESLTADSTVRYSAVTIDNVSGCVVLTDDLPLLE